MNEALAAIIEKLVERFACQTIEFARETSVAGFVGYCWTNF